MSQLERLDETQLSHDLTDPDVAYRHLLLQQQWKREHKRVMDKFNERYEAGADDQELIGLMNDIKALEEGEKSP